MQHKPAHASTGLQSCLGLDCSPGRTSAQRFNALVPATLLALSELGSMHGQGADSQGQGARACLSLVTAVHLLISSCCRASPDRDQNRRVSLQPAMPLAGSVPASSKPPKLAPGAAGWGSRYCWLLLREAWADAGPRGGKLPWLLSPCTVHAASSGYWNEGWRFPSYQGGMKTSSPRFGSRSCADARSCKGRLTPCSLQRH